LPLLRFVADFARYWYARSDIFAFFLTLQRSEGVAGAAPANDAAFRRPV